MTARSRQHRIKPADAAKGLAAERAFAAWLDGSVLPHMYVEQSPLTVPAPLRGQIKRPITWLAFQALAWWPST